MKLVGIAVISALWLCAPCASSSAETIDGANFGPTRVAAPAGAPLGYVTFFSDAAGWTEADDRALAEIAARGALAVGVDTKVYLQNIQVNNNAVRRQDCVNVFQDIEDVSRRVQGLRPTQFYNLPVAAGIGEGGALAYAALAQAKIGTLAAAISVDPKPTLAVSRAICDVDSFPLAAGGGRALGPVAKLNGDWRAAFDASADPAGRQSVEALARAGVPVEISSPSGTESLQTLAALVGQRVEALARRGVESLPLVELPADKPSGVMAVFLSGDGGWRDIDKTVGEQLREMGVSVVGWDTLRYFWSEKTPDQTSADLAAIMAFYGGKWRADKVALIGFSFGADVLPAIYNRLPDAYRDRVSLMALLSPQSAADWEIQIAGWFGARPSVAATPILPELAKTPSALIQCYYGVEDTDSLCIDLGNKGIEVIKTPGGHHFDYSYDMIARDIVAGARKRSPL